jgi:hypothetical protein
MRPRILAVIFGVLLLCSHGALGYSRSDHGILNATSGVIVLDVRSSAEHISNFKLSPGDSFVFNGAFLRLKVRLHSGKILSFDPAQLRKLHGGTTPSEGHWLVDSSGFHYVSLRDYMKAFGRMTKLRPNQALLFSIRPTET